jgi:hypothetical protein
MTSNVRHVVDAADAHRSVKVLDDAKVRKPLHRYAWVGPEMPSNSSLSRQQLAGSLTDHRTPLSSAEDNCCVASDVASGLAASEIPLPPMISSSMPIWTPSAGSCFRPPAPRQAAIVHNLGGTQFDVSGMQSMNQNQQTLVDCETINVVKICNVFILGLYAILFYCFLKGIACEFTASSSFNSCGFCSIRIS